MRIYFLALSALVLPFAACSDDSTPCPWGRVSPDTSVPGCGDAGGTDAEPSDDTEPGEEDTTTALGAETVNTFRSTDVPPSGPGTGAVAPGGTCSCGDQCEGDATHAGLCVNGVCMRASAAECASTGSRAECNAGLCCWDEVCSPTAMPAAAAETGTSTGPAFGTLIPPATTAAPTSARAPTTVTRARRTQPRQPTDARSLPIVPAPITASTTSARNHPASQDRAQLTCLEPTLATALSTSAVSPTDRFPTVMASRASRADRRRGRPVPPNGGLGLPRCLAQRVLPRVSAASRHRCGRRGRAAPGFGSPATLRSWLVDRFRLPHLRDDLRDGERRSRLHRHLHAIISRLSSKLVAGLPEGAAHPLPTGGRDHGLHVRSVPQECEGARFVRRGSGSSIPLTCGRLRPSVARAPA